MIESESVTREDIEGVLDRVRTWPLDRQKDAAAMLMMMEEQGVEPYELSEEELADVQAGLEEAERGEVASDEEVQALFERYGRR